VICCQRDAGGRRVVVPAQRRATGSPQHQSTVRRRDAQRHVEADWTRFRADLDGTRTASEWLRPWNVCGCRVRNWHVDNGNEGSNLTPNRKQSQQKDPLND